MKEREFSCPKCGSSSVIITYSKNIGNTVEEYLACLCHRCKYRWRENAGVINTDDLP